MTQKPLAPGLVTLRQWEREGRIQILETDRATGPAPVPAPNNYRNSTSATRFAKKVKETGALSFAQVAAVVFPFRDSNRLGMQEINTVIHLIRHHAFKHAVFVTQSPELVGADVQRALKSAFKIIVVSPENVVGVVEKLLEDSQPTPDPEL